MSGSGITFSSVSVVRVRHREPWPWWCECAGRFSLLYVVFVSERAAFTLRNILIRVCHRTNVADDQFLFPSRNQFCSLLCSLPQANKSLLGIWYRFISPSPTCWSQLTSSWWGAAASSVFNGAHFASTSTLWRFMVLLLLFSLN